MSYRYQGGDQVHTASGAGMEIKQIGHTNVHAPSRDLVLNNVLYVPQANKGLVSMHKFAFDNDAFFEFHPHYFLIKDQTTKKVLLQGRCEGDLYPLKSSPNKRMLASVKVYLRSGINVSATPLLLLFIKSLARINFRITWSQTMEPCVMHANREQAISYSILAPVRSVSSQPLEVVFLMCGNLHQLWLVEIIFM